MTALWLATVPERVEPPAPGRLRLVPSPAVGRMGDGPGGERRAADRSTRAEDERAASLDRHPSAAVRRRRALLALTGLLVVALALPLSGTGGHSHAAGSAPAGAGAGATYTVKPGDTLWGIAERVDPTADPRPLVARLAAETGSYSVVPGEQIAVP